MEANTKIASVLKKLLEEHLLGAEQARQIEFPVRELTSSEIDEKRVHRIIDHLKEKGLIEVIAFWRGDEAQYEEEPDYDCYKIGFPSDFRKRASEYLSTLIDGKQAEGTILYIDKNGNFWHGNKEKFCYPMGAKSERLKILAYLVDNLGYQDTASIANLLGSKETQGVRTEIGKMRTNITKFLQIEGGEIIESKKDSGYRINPKYKVVKE